jgi:L-lactate dehydrogenase complex protein LldG
VARWEDAVLDGIAEREAPPAQAGVSLIVADLGVVETGAIAFAHGPGRSRAAGLLPDRQIALLARADLVRSTAEALARWFGPGGARTGNLVLAAGPSRTADIEQRLLLGVHAPRSLDVVLYG